MKQQSTIDPRAKKLHLMDEAINTLKLTIPILSKVVNDNLMPGISAPKYPQAVLDRVNALLAELENLED